MNKRAPSNGQARKRQKSSTDKILRTSCKENDRRKTSGEFEKRHRIHPRIFHFTFPEECEGAPLVHWSLLYPNFFETFDVVRVLHGLTERNDREKNRSHSCMIHVRYASYNPTDFTDLAMTMRVARKRCG